ncbi:MAG: hypothetical protein ABJO02_06085 [Reichenbachiella sp.]|uniref:hypothetical protein n=1 Tax=Reichenbachiella sp. TaxID=2184521 RepID=UPI00329A37D2
MASFDEHINQAQSNLSFLDSINKSNDSFWDWHVTVSFYTAVHLINAHIAKKSNQHYRSHELVNNAINPFNSISTTKFSEELYTSYMKLQNLSRRARYLCHDDPKNRDIKAFLTYDKHFSKAIIHLDKIINYMVAEYSVNFTITNLSCIELKNKSLSNFKVA